MLRGADTHNGCHNARVLTKRITKLGYRGSYDSVRRLVARWRNEVAGESQVAQAVVPAPSANRVAWLLFLSPDDLEADDRHLASAIQQRCPDLQVAAELSRAFIRLVKGLSQNW